MNRAGVIRTNSNANSNRRNLAATHDSDDEDDHPQQREGGVQNSTVSPSISPPRRLRIQRPTTNLDSSDSDENEGNISIVSNAYSESVRNRTMTSISHTDSEGTSSLSPSNMTDTNSDTASTHSELDLAIVQTLNINLQLLIYSTVLEDLKRLGVWIKVAPISLAETSWDNVGILVEAPYPRPNAKKVFLTIDLTQQVLDEAIKDESVGVIVSYHPPLFRAFKRLNLSDNSQKIALKCAASGISVYSPHTSLDSVIGGINDWLASGLGPAETKPINLKPDPPIGHEGAGIGRLVNLTEPVKFGTLIDCVKSHLQLKYVRVGYGERNDSSLVSTVAICAGSGASVLNGIKADIYLTGELSHHEVLAANVNNSSVILCEHSNTERGYLTVLKDKLLELLNSDEEQKLEVVQSQLDKDPLTVV
ncbi:hypothetical protein HK098_001545 [Nowakowskiella sp. JEL0407]|nr:hypothetical protein HK098_001545 [Nowakowskiella sp. JEL0407]